MIEVRESPQADQELHRIVENAPVINSIALLEDAEQFVPYDPRSPIAYLDVITKESEPTGSKIIRLLAGGDTCGTEVDFPCVPVEFAEKLQYVVVKNSPVGFRSMISGTLPKMTAVTPVSCISNISVFRDNPNFEKGMVDFRATGINAETFWQVTKMAREYYTTRIDADAWHPLLDWEMMYIYPHTKITMFLLAAKMDVKFALENFKSSTGSVKEKAQTWLSLFNVLGYYKKSDNSQALEMHEQLHTANTNQETLGGDPDKKKNWGMNFIARDVVNVAMKAFSDEAHRHIISSLDNVLQKAK